MRHLRIAFAGLVGLVALAAGAPSGVTEGYTQDNAVNTRGDSVPAIAWDNDGMGLYM